MAIPSIEPSVYARSLRRSMINGTIQLFILQRAQHGSVYGGALTSALRKLGYGISPGTLYPLLHALEHMKLLRSHTTTVQGRIRRYYEITSIGRLCYVEARQSLTALMREMFLDQESGVLEQIPR